MSDQATGKSIFISKTFWVNLIALLAMGVQALNGKWVLTPEIQASILSAVNIALRFITKTPVTWS